MTSRLNASASALQSRQLCALVLQDAPPEATEDGPIKEHLLQEAYAKRQRRDDERHTAIDAADVDAFAAAAASADAAAGIDAEDEDDPRPRTSRHRR